jgi:hypothetical protein
MKLLKCLAHPSKTYNFEIIYQTNSRKNDIKNNLFLYSL